MTKDKSLILVVLFFATVNASFSQATAGKYVIFTFKDKYKISQHATKSYYWIVPQDSIKSYNTILSHLFLKNFSKNDFVDCCNGKDIDPFVVTTNTSYDFDSAYSKSLNELELIISRNTKRLQSISKKWDSGQEEEIRIFATPVYGKFCSSNFHVIGRERYGYEGKVYIPVSSFSYSEEFWKSSAAKFVLAQDFSKIKFDIIPY